MASRRLSAEEAALWARVMAGVRPLAPTPHHPVVPDRIAAMPAVSVLPSARPQPRTMQAQSIPRGRVPSNTLDGTWDRMLGQGRVAPDRFVDLHGHTLASAHDVLDRALTDAIRAGERTILLVTGKAPRGADERPSAVGPVRGAIRAAVGDWLAGSRHDHAIAAVRPAHPRHGGAGALYIVLRRTRPSLKS